ncbi:hypothetical protein ACWEIJ_43225 [Lentzea sp. NPDC004789]
MAIACAAAEEKFVEWLNGRFSPFTPSWFAVALAGAALIVTGFIVASWGLAIAGGALWFFLWRVSEHE